MHASSLRARRKQTSNFKVKQTKASLWVLSPRDSLAPRARPRALSSTCRRASHTSQSHEPEQSRACIAQPRSRVIRTTTSLERRSSHGSAPWPLRAPTTMATTCSRLTSSARQSPGCVGTARPRQRCRPTRSARSSSKWIGTATASSPLRSGSYGPSTSPPGTAWATAGTPSLRASTTGARGA